MQKKLIALAIAGFASTAAFAQVTLYGVADVGLYNTKTTTEAGTTNKQTGVNSGNLSGSRLGVSASEDLGGGTSAVALFESAVNLDANGTTAGNSGLFGISRQAYVGLKSASVGELRLGRQYSAGSAAATGFEPTAGSPTYSIQASVGGDIGADLKSGGVRHDNTVGYIAPTIAGGLVISASYSFGEQNTGAGAAAAKTLSAAGVYTAGPLAVGLMMTQRNDIGGTAAGGVEQEATDLGLGARFDFGILKLFGMVQTTEFEQGNASSEGTQISVGVDVPVGAAGSIQLAVADADVEDTTAGVKDFEGNSRGMSAHYRHALSKRTTAQIGYVSKKFKTDFDTVAANIGDFTKTTTVAAGIRHTF